MPRETKPLTEFEIKKAMPDEKIYTLFDGQGLFLEVTPKGKKYWRLVYQFDKKTKKKGLGVYPGVSLKDARIKRDNIRKILDEGGDPYPPKTVVTPNTMPKYHYSSQRKELDELQRKQIKDKDALAKAIHDMVEKLERKHVDEFFDLVARHSEDDIEVFNHLSSEVNKTHQTRMIEKRAELHTRDKEAKRKESFKDLERELKDGGITEREYTHGCLRLTMNENGFNPSKPATLYYFKIEGVYKIGITNNTLRDRYNPSDFKRIKVIKEWEYAKGWEAHAKEQSIIREFQKYSYDGVTPFTDGTQTSELFTHDILQLDKEAHSA